MDLGAHEVELLAQELGLRVEEGDDAEAAVDGVAVARVRLVEDRLHGVVALGRVHLLQDAQRVAHAVELVHIQELLGLVGREVRRQRALRRALAPLELASRASLGPAPRSSSSSSITCISNISSIISASASASASAIAGTTCAYAPLLLALILVLMVLILALMALMVLILVLMVHSGGVAACIAAPYGPCTACCSSTTTTLMNAHTSH